MSRYDAVVKMWQDWNVHTVDDLALRLDNFRILFAYNSGKIENAEINYHDTREIFENGKVVGSTPMMMLSSTVKHSTSLKCWWTMPMPSALASPSGSFSPSPAFTRGNKDDLVRGGRREHPRHRGVRAHIHRL